MGKFYQYIDGYLQVELTGYGMERFLNLCMNKEFTLWEIVKGDDVYRFYISLKDFRELKPLLKKTETKIHILKKCGLPFSFIPIGSRNALCWVCCYVWALCIICRCLYGIFMYLAAHTIRRMKSFLISSRHILHRELRLRISTAWN